MTVFADLAAEKLFVAEKAEQKIIVEVKSFMGKSSMHEFETALGQYNSYLPLIKKLNLSHKLYLAVSAAIYQRFFTRKAIQAIIEWHQLAIIVVDISHEEVVAWIN